MIDAFDGKIAIVTGGTSGIGYAVSEALLKRGATVYVIGSRKESVEKAEASLARYPNVRFAVVNVTRADEVQKMVDDCVAGSGRLDYLFNNAGVGATVPFEQVTLEYWKQVIDLNLWGVIYGVHAAFPVMVKQGSGHIVNTSSIAGVFPPPYQAVYCATKYAVTGMTEALRYELAYQGISFSTVCPSNVATPIFAAAGKVPDDAISAGEAAGIILAGVERKEGLIIFPEKVKQMYEQMKRDQAFMDEELFKMAEQRRKAYETGGNYF
jgi:NAD(P)-dependent dehydrogenase (short-subunit alcohol dehydrogenase family)